MTAEATPTGITETAGDAALFAPARRCFSVAEYHAMGKAGIFAPDERVQLVDGEIFRMPPIGDWHASSVDIFANLFPPQLDGRAIVRIQNPVRLDAGSEPEPDVALLRWRDDFYQSGHPGPSDVLLVVEVADSTLDFDRNQKLSAYAHAGIPEVWILSRNDGRVEAYTDPAEGGYQRVRYVGRGESISPQAFPDIALDVGLLFPESPV